MPGNAPRRGGPSPAHGSPAVPRARPATPAAGRPAAGPRGLRPGDPPGPQPRQRLDPGQRPDRAGPAAAPAEGIRRGGADLPGRPGVSSRPRRGLAAAGRAAPGPEALRRGRRRPGPLPRQAGGSSPRTFAYSDATHSSGPTPSKWPPSTMSGLLGEELDHPLDGLAGGSGRRPARTPGARVAYRPPYLSSFLGPDRPVIRSCSARP